MIGDQNALQWIIGDWYAIVKPLDFIDPWIGVDKTFKINVRALFDGVPVQLGPQFHGHLWLVCVCEREREKMTRVKRIKVGIIKTCCHQKERKKERKEERNRK